MPGSSDLISVDTAETSIGCTLPSPARTHGSNRMPNDWVAIEIIS